MDSVIHSLLSKFHAAIIWGKKGNLYAYIWANGGSSWKEWDILKLEMLLRNSRIYAGNELSRTWGQHLSVVYIAPVIGAQTNQANHDIRNPTGEQQAYSQTFLFSSIFLSLTRWGSQTWQVCSRCGRTSEKYSSLNFTKSQHLNPTKPPIAISLPSYIKS